MSSRAQNAFEKGKVAMNVDGEWRTAFIADEAPNLNYGTAPVPVDDDRPASTAAATRPATSPASPSARSTPSTRGRC